jgi:hypothetical protein
MPSVPPPPPGACPVCRGSDFTLQSSGFPIRSSVFSCAGCGTKLKPFSDSGIPSFRVSQVGSLFSNAAPMLGGQAWTSQELSSPANLSRTYPDSELLQIAQGTLAEDLTAGDEDCEAPFATDPGEVVIFALENLYSWESRPRGEQLAPGLKAFQVKPGDWKDLPVLGEPRAYYLIETLDSGALYITDRRYAFFGKKRRIDDDFSRIQAVLPFKDGFGVFRKDRVKIEFYKGDVYWPLVGATLAGLVLKWRREHAARETRRDNGIPE